MKDIILTAQLRSMGLTEEQISERVGVQKQQVRRNLTLADALKLPEVEEYNILKFAAAKEREIEALDADLTPASVAMHRIAIKHQDEAMGLDSATKAQSLRLDKIEGEKRVSEALELALREASDD